MWRPPRICPVTRFGARTGVEAVLCRERYGDGRSCCFWRPELPSVNFAWLVQPGPAFQCSGCLTRPSLACLLGFLCWGKGVKAGGGWHAARSMCEQSVEPDRSRRVCACVWWLGLLCVCEGGEGLPYLLCVITS